MPTMSLDGDASGALRAHAQLDNAVKKSSQGYKEMFLDVEKLRDGLTKAFDESPMDRYIRKCDELSKKLVEGKISAGDYAKQTEQLAKGLKQTGDSHSEAFGSHTVGELASYAAGLVTVHKAIEFVTEAMREQNEEKKRAAENVAGGLPGAGQIANVSPSEVAFQHNVAIQRRLMDEGIVPRNQQAMAGQAAAGMAQGELSPADEEFVINLAKQKRVAAGSIGTFTTGAQAFREAYGPAAGSFQDVSKQLLTAGADTLGRASGDEIALQVTDFAQQAKDAGMSPQQALATYTAIARTAKSKRSAATRVKDIFEGKADLSPEETARASTELGRIRGAAGSGLPDYVATDPRFSAARGAEEAQGQTSGLIEDRVAEGQSLYEQMKSEQQAYEVRLGWGGFHRNLSNAARGVSEFFGGQEETLRATAADPQYRDQLSPELLKKIEEHLSRQTQIMEKTDRTAPSPSGRQE